MIIYDNTGKLLLDIPVDDDSYRDMDMTPYQGAGK